MKTKHSGKKKTDVRKSRKLPGKKETDERTKNERVKKCQLFEIVQL